MRTGDEYLASLRDHREVWHRGRRINDVTEEPGMARGARTLANFLDRQHSPEWVERLSFGEPGGSRSAMSFLIPTSADDVRRRGIACYEWAKWSQGMFGRTPDYKNASLMAFAAAAEFLNSGMGPKPTDFSANMRAYYDKAKREDLVLTHTLVNPQFSAERLKQGLSSPEVALHLVEEKSDGIVVSGARLLATLGPLANDIEVFPSTLLKAAPENIPYAFAFTLPVATQGMRMLCRDSYDENKPLFDAPLSGRFEEMDAVVIFDNVFVPWHRVFMYQDPLLCNRAFAQTNAVIHMMHQVACAKLAKAEFIIGLLCAMAHASDKDKDAQVKGRIAEVMWMTETVRALLFSAEMQAEVDQYGNYMPKRQPLDTCRNLFPRFYPKMIEAIQMLGSSSLMATPAGADFNNEISAEVEKYFELTNSSSRDRVALFRLAHDLAVSGFGGRQVLYERFFFGPQEIMASIYYDLYDKQPFIERVEGLINSSG